MTYSCGTVGDGASSAAHIHASSGITNICRLLGGARTAGGGGGRAVASRDQVEYEHRPTAIVPPRACDVTSCTRLTFDSFF